MNCYLYSSKDLVKNSISRVEKIASDLLRDYQHGLHQQKSYIINRLKSSENELIANIKQNPKLWNSACLHIELNKSSIGARETNGPFGSFGLAIARYRPIAGNKVGLSSSICIKKPEVAPQSSD